MKHLCHAVDCKTPVKPTLLMCARHWAMVPVEIQRAVNRNYRRGQCGDKRPSLEWIKAARSAIEEVASPHLAQARVER